MASFPFNSTRPQGKTPMTTPPDWFRPVKVTAPPPALAMATAATAAVATAASPNDVLASIEWLSSRILWVQRKISDDHHHTSVLWPALCFQGWEEVSSYYSQYDRNTVLSKEQKAELAMNVYQASLMEDDDDDDDDDDVDEETTGSNNNGNVPVLARLLGLEEERDSLLDFFLELSPPADVLGEFWSWAPQAICCSRDPSTFGGPLDWYLPLMKGIDEAFDLMKRTTSNSKSTVTHKTMFQVGQQRLAAFQKKQQRQQRQQRRQEGKEATTPTGGAVKASLMAPSPMTTSPTTTAAVDAASPTSVLAIINCETPQQQQQLQLQQQSQLQDPTPESMATSPSSSSYSSQETTPTHSNKKMRPRNGPRNDSNRDLFPKTNHPKASGTPSFLSSSSSSSPTATTTTTTAAARSESNDTQPALGDATKTNGNKRRSASASNYVTPSRSSRRPKRQAVLKTDALTPTSSRRHSHDDDDDDEFYFFANLIQFLQHALGWKYSKAKSDLHAWVYERVDTAGEPNGTYLEDYFYEEQQVVDYCRHHNYKEQYGHYLILAGKPNATDEDGMGGGNAQAIITPPGAKRTRTTIH